MRPTRSLLTLYELAVRECDAKLAELVHRRLWRRGTARPEARALLVARIVRSALERLGLR